jgi:hypothetical protein
MAKIQENVFFKKNTKSEKSLGVGRVAEGGGGVVEWQSGNQKQENPFTKSQRGFRGLPL